MEVGGSKQPPGSPAAGWDAGSVDAEVFVLEAGFAWAWGFVAARTPSSEGSGEDEIVAAAFAVFVAFGRDAGAEFEEFFQENACKLE